MRRFCFCGHSTAPSTQNEFRCDSLAQHQSGHCGNDNDAPDLCGSNTMRAAQYLVPVPVPPDARRLPFDSVTIRFHWATVLIVLGMFVTAWLHAQSHDAVLKAALLQTHRSLGVTIWLITVLRLAWRLTHAKLPPFPSTMTSIHRAIVKASEYALYALLLIQPITGMGDTLFRGRPFDIFFWQIPPLVATNAALRDAFQTAHQFGACAFGALVVGHAAAALFHHFVFRDDVLQCMAPVITTARSDQDYLSGGVVRSEQL